MTTNPQPAGAKPAWAQRIQAQRQARGWTQRQATEALRLHADRPLPDEANLLRMWKNWEAGKHRPGPEYRRTIAAAFGTVSASLFGPDEAAWRSQSVANPPPDDKTIELVERLRRSDLDAAGLDTLAITVDRLCSEYPYVSSADLRREAVAWMSRLNALLDARLTLDQHREILVHAGWLTLLIGCVEHDMMRTAEAEGSRRAALQLGKEAGHVDIEAWAHEMRAWFALTQGRYREVVEASRQGRAVAPQTSVAVQLAGQEAKAWARMGDRRQVELALDGGRTLLESLPYPDNVRNHFAVDPDKFDFYAMDCYRRVGENALASMHAEEVIRKSTTPDGSVRSPMRIAEAELTLAVVAAREGDLECAVDAGTAALEIPRRSVPSLMLVGQDLATEISTRFGRERSATRYLERMRALTETPEPQ